MRLSMPPGEDGPSSSGQTIPETRNPRRWHTHTLRDREGQGYPSSGSEKSSVKRKTS